VGSVPNAFKRSNISLDKGKGLRKAFGKRGREIEQATWEVGKFTYGTSTTRSSHHTERKKRREKKRGEEQKEGEIRDGTGEVRQERKKEGKGEEAIL